MKEPETIELTTAEVESLRAAIEFNTTLSLQHKALLISLLDNHTWLQFLLAEAKISISRLCQTLIKKSERRPKDKAGDDELPKTDDEANGQVIDVTPESSNSVPPEKPNRKGCGRLSEAEYTAAKNVDVPHADLCPGDNCPDPYCDGKLYQMKKQCKTIRISGNSLLTAIRYLRERLACNLCKTVYTAELPPEANPDKYDEAATAMIAISRIQLGIPMYRLARFQRECGLPLPEGTQWEIIKTVYAVITHIYSVLYQMAAQMPLFYIDDTWV